VTKLCTGLAALIGALALVPGLAAAPARAAGAAQPDPTAGAAGEGAPAGAAEAADCLDRTASAVQRRYEGVRDLSARFEQTTRAASLGEGGSDAETTEQGHVVFAKPGRMRWSYEKPDPSLVVSDGKTLWIYDPEFEEVQKLPVGEGYLSGAAIQFLLGRGDMRDAFHVTALSCAPRAAELELVPKQPATYEKLRITADPETGAVSRTEIVDILGNVTRVTFSDVRTNTDPPASVFHFDPPKGVKVVEIQR
jgi:outer membrane lipoprotein carrier protein